MATAIEQLRAYAVRRGVVRPGVLALVCVLSAGFMTDFAAAPDVTLRVGDLSAHDVVAPISYTFRDQDTTDERQGAAEQRVDPVFEADITALRRVENRITQAFDMARRRYAAEAGAHVVPRRGGVDAPDPVLADFATALNLKVGIAELLPIADGGYSIDAEEMTLELLGVAMRRSVIEDRSDLPSPPRPIAIRNLLGGQEVDEVLLDDYGQVRTAEEAGQAVSLYVLERFAGSRQPDLVKAAATIARAGIRPNLRFDPVLTGQRQAEARDAIPVVDVQVRRGTRIVRAGDVVGANQVQMLEALASAYQGGGRLMFGTWLAYVVMLLGTALGFARATIRKFSQRDDDLFAMGGVLVSVLAVSRVLSATAAAWVLPGLDASGLALLAPVAAGAMVVRVLVNSESALIWAIVASLCCAAMTDQSALLAVFYLMTALVAAAGVGQARERLAVVRAGLQAGLLGAGAVVLMTLVRSQGPGGESVPDLMSVVILASIALAAGFLNAALALLAIPAFEVFGFTTDYKLLELSNLNHPLLRQLMLRAPGTYHHSVIVGSLSEAACEAIGANALLARVACYFHDIGKGLKPQYFVENQRESGNRHDRLSAEHSAQLIINHVIEGGALAEQYKLPRPIIDQIYMHHGTGLIQYFYAKAKEHAGPDDVVDEARFRYPGPKPDSREAGVIMLADKVEAACRTIKDPSEARIRAMIQQIVNSVMVDGQLEQCPLTLKELYQIADTFTMVLLGIYHHRIEYPATASISSGKGRFVPVPRQGTITLEILNPLSPPPPGSPDAASSSPAASGMIDYESAEQLPGVHRRESDE
jgi:putative nucleotidyltransferase with HDIG domain